MSQVKQIEEIRCENCIHHFACRLNGEYDPSPCRAYEDKAGYRKQSEGEWEKKFLYAYNYDDYYMLTCPKCGESFRDIHGATISKKYRYCSVCGAKMKGGDTDA